MTIRNQSLQNRIMLCAASTIMIVIMTGCSNGRPEDVNNDYDTWVNSKPISTEEPQRSTNDSPQPSDDELQTQLDKPDLPILSENLEEMDKSKSAETSSMRDSLTTESPFTLPGSTASWNADDPKLSGISMLDTSTSIVDE